MNWLNRYGPWLIVAVGSLYFLSAARPPRDREGEWHLNAFGSIPVLDQGRVKPIDTYARVQLMILSRKQTYTDEFDNTGQPATRWLLNLFAEGLANWSDQVPMPDDEVRKWFELPQRRANVYRVDEVVEAAQKKQQALAQILKKAEGQRSELEEKVVMTAAFTVGRKKTLDEIQAVQKKQGNPSAAKVFRIDNDQVLAMLDLKPRSGFRYSIEEIAKNRDKFSQFLKKAFQARSRDEKSRDLVDHKCLELLRQLNIHQDLSQLAGLLAVPASKGDLENWKSIAQALQEGDERGNPAAASWEKIVRAYATGDVKAFNSAVGEYRASMTDSLPAEARKARIEVWFNHFAPFYRCANLYVAVFLLAVLSWVVWPQQLTRAAFWLAFLILLVHTLALVLRMYLQGRPPVTNLYSSAVFIGWGCVLLCLIIEAIYRNGVGSAVAALLGFGTMIVAHHLGGSGDTLEMMQAVLDTNFWLATHVTTVTMGYTATFVAGFIAIAYLFLMLASMVLAFFRNRSRPGWTSPAVFLISLAGVVAIPAVLALGLLCGLWFLWFSDELPSDGVAVTMAVPVVLASLIYGAVVAVRYFSPTPEDLSSGQTPGPVRWLDQVHLTATSSKMLTSVIYGVVCFATLLSFVGTVLGGIWADYSWGRFWGWDPKENGALLIVIMNALILHARWSGLIRERGLVVLALCGNMVTMWSWFGTNQLGIGLHAYGFNKALVLMCSWFWLSQLLLMGLASVPLKYWRSYAVLAEPAQKPTTPPRATLKPGPRSSTSVVAAR